MNSQEKTGILGRAATRSWQWFRHLGPVKKILVVSCAVIFALIGIVLLNNAYLVYIVAHRFTGQPVRIELAHRTIDAPILYVPAEYLGLTRLDLVRKNLGGGKQEALVINAGFPSFKAWRGKESEAEGDDMMMLMVYASANLGLPNLWQSESRSYQSEGMSEFEIAEYSYRANLPIKKHETKRVFYFSGDDKTRPVIIKCPNTGTTEKNRCRMSIDMGGTRLYFDAIFPMRSMPQWRAAVKSIEDFVIGLTVKPRS